jgi:DNA repair exonuclease SbcCD ATPase subunit
LDDNQVYTPQDQALAFEISAGERIAADVEELQRTLPDLVFFNGPVDKVFLYRQVLCCDSGLERRAAFAKLLQAQYPKSWDWITERSTSRERAEETGGRDLLLEEFLERLEGVAPLAREGLGQDRLLGFLQGELRDKEGVLRRLRDDLEFAEDRVRRAHQNLKKAEEEGRQLQKQLREARENGEKLRQERTRRIQLDRQAAEAGGEVERLRQECAKLDARLRQLAQRLAEAERQPSAGGVRIEVAQLRQVEARQLLGVEGMPGEEELNQLRRRFAAALHSDRMGQLPAWVGQLFDQVLSAVNEACDRLKK